MKNISINDYSLVYKNCKNGIAGNLYHYNNLIASFKGASYNYDEMLNLPIVPNMVYNNHLKDIFDKYHLAFCPMEFRIIQLLYEANELDNTENYSFLSLVLIKESFYDVPNFDNKYIIPVYHSDLDKEYMDNVIWEQYHHKFSGEIEFIKFLSTASADLTDIKFEI